MKLIAYANFKEVEYIWDCFPYAFIEIGFKGEFISEIDFVDKNVHTKLQGEFDEIILFGSCGLLQRFHQDACEYCIWGEEKLCSKCPYKIANGDLISPGKWIMGDKMVEADQILPTVPVWGNGVTIDYSCRDRNKVLWEHPEAICVDQESYLLGKWCKDRNIKFQSVRYIIDRCVRMYPPPFNHFWRRKQHKKMQEKFLELI